MIKSGISKKMVNAEVDLLVKDYDVPIYGQDKLVETSYLNLSPTLETATKIDYLTITYFNDNYANASYGRSRVGLMLKSASTLGHIDQHSLIELPRAQITRSDLNVTFILDKSFFKTKYIVMSFTKMDRRKQILEITGRSMLKNAIRLKHTGFGKTHWGQSTTT